MFASEKRIKGFFNTLTRATQQKVTVFYSADLKGLTGVASYLYENKKSEKVKVCS